MYPQELIQTITTKRIASFDGLITKTNGIRAWRRDGKPYIDLCGGIGFQNTFGADVSISGHLMRSPLYDEYVVKLAHIFPFSHALPVSSGDKAVLFALKLAYEKAGVPQRKAVAIVMGNAFHGRSPEAEALSGGDITPLIALNRIIRIPFYSPKKPYAAMNALHAILENKKIRPFCFLTELFQGEGGFNSAPPSFFVPLFSACNIHGIPIIVDEVHTCCKTGFPLLLQRFDITQFADIVVIGKTTQTPAVLFKDGYNADRARISETNPGGAEEQLKKGISTLTKLAKEGYWGLDGKIMKLERELCEHFELMKKRLPHIAYTVLGSMAAIQLPCFTKKEPAQLFVNRLVTHGVLTTTCGRGKSYKVRMYFPFIVKPEQLRGIFSRIEKVARSFGTNGKGE